MLAYCCPPPWPSGWGSRRPLTSSSTSVTAPARRAPAASPGPGLPAVGVHGDGRAVILDDRDADAPVLEEARLLARLSRGSRVVLFELSERVNCGFFRVGCWVDGAMAWQIIHCREEPETEEYQILGIPPGIFADKAAPYRAQQAQVDAAGEEEICYLGQAVVELFVSLTGIHYDRDGWWWDLRYRDLKPIDRASG
jgi:hypothetical protein